MPVVPQQMGLSIRLAFAEHSLFLSHGIGLAIREPRSWSHSVEVITQDFESCDPGSNPGGTSIMSNVLRV